LEEIRRSNTITLSHLFERVLAERKLKRCLTARLTGNGQAVPVKKAGEGGSDTGNKAAGHLRNGRGASKTQGRVLAAGQKRNTNHSS